MSFRSRTHTCGELRASNAGETVILNGWIHRVRDLGGLWFADMRDRTGLVQIALDPEKFPNRAEIRPECCLEVEGVVTLRDEKTKNSEMPTGEIEVVLTSYNLLSPAKPLPFPVSDEAPVSYTHLRAHETTL
ncbi:MAG: aspartate--tRNA ligase, partial [Armatimonadetes bacterium Cent15-Ar3]